MFEPSRDNDKYKNNGGGIKLGKQNIFDKNEDQKDGQYIKTDSKSPSFELYDK